MSHLDVFKSEVRLFSTGMMVTRWAHSTKGHLGAKHPNRISSRATAKAFYTASAIQLKSLDDFQSLEFRSSQNYLLSQKVWYL